MKILRPLILTLLLLVLIYLFTCNLFKAQIGVGPNLLFHPQKSEEIVFSKMIKIPSCDRVMLYGINSKDEKNVPSSYLAIYSVCDSRLLYRFAPSLPSTLGYFRPLMIEKAEIMQDGSDQFILTSWGETGADYFGTHPILIKYEKDRFRAVKFYKGYLSDSPRIRHFSWTSRDFEVANYFDPTDRVFTILTQGVSAINKNMIGLSFYGDEKPHAAEHKYILFTFPLPKTGEGS